MKYRWLIFGFAGLYILAAAFGIFMKENYTNVTEQENWQQNFNVAQLPGRAGCFRGGNTA